MIYNQSVARTTLGIIDSQLHRRSDDSPKPNFRSKCENPRITEWLVSFPIRSLYPSLPPNFSLFYLFSFPSTSSSSYNLDIKLLIESVQFCYNRRRPCVQLCNGHAPQPHHRAPLCIRTPTSATKFHSKVAATIRNAFYEDSSVDNNNNNNRRRSTSLLCYNRNQIPESVRDGRAMDEDVYFFKSSPPTLINQTRAATRNRQIVIPSNRLDRISLYRWTVECVNYGLSVCN